MASSTIPLARSTWPLAGGWATETISIVDPDVLAVLTELMVLEVGTQVCD
jgi:hypothetical protein